MIAGLFTRMFHAGLDQFALLMTDTQGLTTANAAVEGYYTLWREMTWHPMRMLPGAIVTGWIVLAVGVYRSRTMGLVRSIALGLMAILALGTLKGTQVPQSLLAVGGLCVALVPVGVDILRSGPPPTRRGLLLTAAVVTMLVLGIFFAPRG